MLVEAVVLARPGVRPWVRRTFGQRREPKRALAEMVLPSLGPSPVRVCRRPFYLEFFCCVSLMVMRPLSLSLVSRVSHSQSLSAVRERAVPHGPKLIRRRFTRGCYIYALAYIPIYTQQRRSYISAPPSRLFKSERSVLYLPAWRRGKSLPAWPNPTSCCRPSCRRPSLRHST